MKRTINGKTYSKTLGVKKGELAVFGDDGELTSSGKKPSDIHDSELPAGGTNGQVLTKKAGGVEWKDVPKELPTYNVDTDYGKVLTIQNQGLTWKGERHLYAHRIEIMTYCFDEQEGVSSWFTFLLPTQQQFNSLFDLLFYLHEEMSDSFIVSGYGNVYYNKTSTTYEYLYPVSAHTRYAGGTYPYTFGIVCLNPESSDPYNFVRTINISYTDEGQTIATNIMVSRFTDSVEVVL